MASSAVLMSQELFRSIVAYQSGVLLDLVLLDHEWKRELRITEYRSDGVAFTFPYGGRTVRANELFLYTLDVRFPLHLSMFRDQPSIARLYANANLTSLLEADASHTTLTCAAKYGPLSLFQHLYSIGFSCTSRTIVTAATYGHMDILIYLNSATSGIEWTASTVDGAAQHGHLDVVRYLHSERGLCATLRGFEEAATYGHVHVLRYLHTNQGLVGTAFALQRASGNNHIATIEYLFSSSTFSTADVQGAIEWSLGRKQFDAVRYLVDQRPDVLETPTETWLEVPASIALVQYLHEKGVSMDTSNINFLTESGDIDLVRYLTEKHIGAWSSFAITVAAAGLHTTSTERNVYGIYVREAGETTVHKHQASSLAVIQYLRDHGVPVETGALVRAARHGMLDIIKVLFPASEAPCDPKALIVAAAEGHLDIVKYLYNQGVRGPDKLALRRAAKFGHLKVVRFLDLQFERCSSAAMDRAARRGHLQVVKYLHRNRREGCTAAAIDDAAANGHLDVVEFLTQQGKPATTHAVDEAARRGHTDVVKYLLEARREGFTDVALRDARTATIRHLLEDYLCQDCDEECLSDSGSDADEEDNDEEDYGEDSEHEVDEADSWESQSEDFYSDDSDDENYDSAHDSIHAYGSGSEDMYNIFR
ncbi:hypothetical protein ACHHYP_07081 [Achlya hypogyna]|uniref:Uncharacterized protein n=1 Tax=Achlya hypogyna TaxID=1202772 RepID=A0A1V9ZMS6_ACHHY|nr:hypothetical protein ACHHYP_07081 [Achlya hypogyna]